MSAQDDQPTNAADLPATRKAELRRLTLMVALYALAGPPLGTLFFMVAAGLKSGALFEAYSEGLRRMLELLPEAFVLCFPIGLPFAAITGLLSACLPFVTNTNRQFVAVSLVLGLLITAFIPLAMFRWDNTLIPFIGAGGFAALCCAMLSVRLRLVIRTD